MKKKFKKEIGAELRFARYGSDLVVCAGVALVFAVVACILFVLYPDFESRHQLLVLASNMTALIALYVMVGSAIFYRSRNAAEDMMFELAQRCDDSLNLYEQRVAILVCNKRAARTKTSFLDSSVSYAWRELEKHYIGNRFFANRCMLIIGIACAVVLSLCWLQ